MSPLILASENYINNAHALPTLLTGMTLLVSGLLTVYQERGTRVSLAFFCLVFAASWWLFSFSMMYLAATEAVALTWAKLAYLSVPLIAPSAYQFTIIALRLEDRRGRLMQITWLLGLVFVMLAVGTDKLITGVYRAWWGYYTQFGWLSIPFLAYFATMLVASLAEYALAYSKTEPGTHRIRIRGLMVASTIGYLGAYDFIPAYGIVLYPIGYLAVLVFLLLIARTILRYRLVDLTPSFAAEQIIATMADPLIVCDAEDNIRVVNSAACAIFGYTEQQLLGHPITLLCHPAPEEVQKLRDCLRQPVVRDRELEFYATDGSAVPVSLSISHLQSKQGISLGTVVIIRDLRARQEAEAALRMSQERLGTVVSKAPIILFALDREGVFTLAEGQFLHPFSMEARQLVGRSIFDLLPDMPGQRERFQQALLGKRGAAITELEGFTYDTRYSPLRDENGQVVGLIGVATEITDRRRAEQALRESEERYMLAARGANDGLWDWNLTDQTIYYSPRWKEMLGYEQDEIDTDPDEWFGRIHPDDNVHARLAVRSHLAGHSAHLESEHRIRHRDGSYRWVLCRGLAVRDVEGQATRAAGSLTDITARKQSEAQLMHEALHDPLTGLPNRALLMDRLQHAIVRQKRVPSSTFALLYLDFDHFKVINDSLGHVVGDQLLVAVAERLQANQRSNDTVARLGGDEFVILLEDVQAVSNATQVAERVQHEMTAPFTLSSREIFTSVSIGIIVVARIQRHPR
jgi:diguanylate cyclase (GGDEF)-like protein/PAS domain S-box-containing protein